MSDIEWRGQSPYSRQFSDIYFNADDGVAESYYVFCEGNRLATRFSELDSNANFIIGELGFGTGLNFLVAARTFLQANTNAHLSFISFEKFPLRPEDLARALSEVDGLGQLRCGLLKSYTHALRHQNTFWQIDWQNIHLTVHFGDASTIIHRTHISANAWFFDGFAPNRNADLWQTDLFKKIAVNGYEDTTFSTFTAATKVQQNLTEAGFIVHKRKGYGRKRESLYGELRETPPPRAPWLRSPRPIDKSKHIAIIGAGIAGSLTARKLAEYGYNVDLIDKHSEVATQTSGQKRLILYPRLTRDWSVLGSYAWLGLAAQYQNLMTYCPSALDGNGVALMGYTPKEEQRLKKIAASEDFDPENLTYLTPCAMSETIGVNSAYGGIDIAHGGTVDVQKYCRALSQHPCINLRLNTTVKSIEKNNQWLLTTNGEDLNYDVIILANAYFPIAGLEEYHLPIRSIRGQVSHFSETNASRPLKRVLCHKGYISPSIDGTHLLGATFNPNDDNTHANVEHDQINLNTFEQHLSAIANIFALKEANSALADVAFRASSPDHLPLVGAIAKLSLVEQVLAPLAKDASKIPSGDFQWDEGLYCNVGHGSRGLIGSALCAAHLVALITNTPTPLPTRTHEHIEPQRFSRRAISRSN